VIISITFDPAFDFFLAKSHKGRDLAYPLTRSASVKDIIESLGVPHTEVGRICFNDQDIDFSFIPDTPGKLDIHAVDAPFDVGSPSLLRPEPLDRVRFVADVNVLKLGRLLILLEPKTRKYFFDFFQCPTCGKVFWKGSHYEAMKKTFTSHGLKDPDK
jgi:hypothetical protein